MTTAWPGSCRPLERARHRRRHRLGVERSERRRRCERGELGALAGEDCLRQAELLQQPAEGGGAEPGGERELQPARQPGVLTHCRFFLGRLHHIQRATGLVMFMISA